MARLAGLLGDGGGAERSVMAMLGVMTTVAAQTRSVPEGAVAGAGRDLSIASEF